MTGGRSTAHSSFFMTMHMKVFTKENQDRVTYAIGLAENQTSGEIRLVVENKLSADDSLSSALYYFEKLDMHNTSRRNGVLFYMALEDKAFSVIGDKGINDKVPDGFWEAIRGDMVEQFKHNNIVDGLIVGITEVGERLKEFFPVQEDDINELPNDIHFGKNS